jgi:quinol monooxygenase YgiN
MTAKPERTRLFSLARVPVFSVSVSNFSITAGQIFHRAWWQQTIPTWLRLPAFERRVAKRLLVQAELLDFGRSPLGFLPAYRTRKSTDGTGCLPGDQPKSIDCLVPGRVGLIVRAEAKPGTRPVLLEALNNYLDGLDDEPGTEAFFVLLDPDDEDVVWLHSWFANAKAITRHQSSPRFEQLIATAADVLAEPPAVLQTNPLRLHLKRTVFEEPL